MPEGGGEGPGAKDPSVELSVVVCSLGSSSVDETVESLTASAVRAGREVEVIVVWQGVEPAPNLPEGARALEVFPVGISHARNRGLAVARGELVGFVDDDEQVDEGWVAAAFAAFDGEPATAGAFGPVLRREPQGPPYFQPSRERVFFRDPRTPPWLVGTGGNMVFRREPLVGAGGFDPRFGIGGPARSAEETDLFLRLLGEHRALVFTPELVVYHPVKSKAAELQSRSSYAFGMGSALRRSPLLTCKYLYTIGQELARATRLRNRVRSREALVTLRSFLAGVGSPLRASSSPGALERLPATLRAALEGVEPRPLRSSLGERPHLRYAAGDRLLHLYVSPEPGLLDSLASPRTDGDSALEYVVEGDALWVLERR